MMNKSVDKSVDNLIKHFDRSKPNVVCEKTDLDFMAREWFAEDTVLAENDSDDVLSENSDTIDSDDEKINKSYCIYIFGVNDKAESICLKVTDFTPYIYVKIPSDWDKNKCAMFVKNMRRGLGENGPSLIGGRMMLKKEAYGFNNNKFTKFVRLTFKTYDAYRHCSNKLKYPIRGYYGVKFGVYESSIDPMIVFIHLRDIKASGWINVKKNDLSVPDKKFSRCQHNYITSWKKVNPDNENDTIPPFVTMSFDIEVFSFDYSFPLPSCPQNFITQIGSSFQRFGDDDKFLKTVVVVGECDPIPGVHLIVCKNEKSLIKKWVDLVAQMDPDQIIGYNIDDFDWTYIWERAVYTNTLEYITDKLPRLHHLVSTFKKDNLSSAAYGINTFNYITTPGVGQIDLLHWFRKNTKLSSYRLGAVSKEYLGDSDNDTKNEIEINQIFDWSGPEATPKERSIVAAYCAQDTLLPLRLMENRCMFPNLVEMSRVTYVPFTWLITRGEQIKAYSQINKVLRQNDFVLPGYIKGNAEQYEGATVLNCDRGMHFEPVSGLDFASLYPSIMIAWNMCPTTWVNKEDYKNIDGVEYKDFDTETGCHTFVQSTPGIVPGILDRLWKERKIVKKQMAAEKDPRMKAILNGKQLAIKVSMNSIYGFFGVDEGAMPCKAIAASVTFTGRQMIKHSKECAETWYDGSEKSNFVKARVIYGDSVSGETVLVIKNENETAVTKIEDYFNLPRDKLADEFYCFKGKLINGKEMINITNGDKIMTQNGWKKVKRVIRHKCNKKLYRVTTKYGTVIVTEDHSLLDKTGKQIKPKETTVNKTELMHRVNFWKS